MLSGGFRFALPTLRNGMTKEKRKRNADRRVQPTSASRDAARALVSFPSPACGGGLGRGHARLSAFHRGSCCSERTPQLSSRYALPGTWSGRSDPKASNNRVRKTVRLLTAGVTRSFLSQSSEVTSQTGHNAGRACFPKPPGSGVYRSARGHRTRSTFGSTLGRRRPRRARFVKMYLKWGQKSMESLRAGHQLEGVRRRG